jgi:lysyl-tRNA synthetase class 2
LALDEKIYELRREKLKQIEALGQQVYPRKYDFTHVIPQIVADYVDKTAEQLENPVKPDSLICNRVGTGCRFT